LIQSGEADAAHLPCNLDLRLDLDSAARRLAQHERCLLALVAEGLSHGEIAERLSLGWKSVGSRVQRLRRKLGLLLADASGWRKRLR
jgi:DNA-directed RNA polymerase specialized sigma24 family protein